MRNPRRATPAGLTRLNAIFCRGPASARAAGERGESSVREFGRFDGTAIATAIVSASSRTFADPDRTVTSRGLVSPGHSEVGAFLSYDRNSMRDTTKKPRLFPRFRRGFTLGAWRCGTLGVRVVAPQLECDPFRGRLVTLRRLCPFPQGRVELVQIAQVIARVVEAVLGVLPAADRREIGPELPAPAPGLSCGNGRGSSSRHRRRHGSPRRPAGRPRRTARTIRSQGVSPLRALEPRVVDLARSRRARFARHVSP